MGIVSSSAGQACQPANLEMGRGGKANKKANGKGTNGNGVVQKFDKAGGQAGNGAAEAGAKNKVLKKRISGKVTEWKGRFGWVQPNQPVDHPMAQKNKGRIYLAQEDVELDISGVGALVNFFLYADGKGLGAKNVRPDGAAGGNGAANGNGHSAKGKTKGSPAVANAPQKQAGNNRQKVGGKKLTGKVLEWKGNFGFIMPSVPVNHPDAGKKGGKIYFSGEDVEAELSGVGAAVTFFLYKDKTGLGASNVRPGGKASNGITPQAKQGKQPLVKNTKLKVKKEAKGPSAPLDESLRTPVSTGSIGGTVIASRRETIGWIRPDDVSSIDHPKWEESKRRTSFCTRTMSRAASFQRSVLACSSLSTRTRRVWVPNRSRFWSREMARCPSI